ncbi:hypothetical protein MMC30_004893 [Trapelia coarctata]|nr:hypothetical protein [Trapelia coarctata]
MSLGCRACNRSRALGISSLLATPRDTFTFLHLPLYLRSCRAVYGTSNAQAQIIEQAEDDKRFSTDPRAQPTGGVFIPQQLETTIQPSSGGPENEPKLPISLVKTKWTKEEHGEPPGEDGNSIESMSQKNTVLGPASVRFVQTNGEKQQPLDALNNYEDLTKSLTLKETLLGTKRSHSNSGQRIRFVATKGEKQHRFSDPSELLARTGALRGPTTETIQETLQLKPTTIRRLLSKAKKKEELRDAAVIGVKGSWAHDWRLPLDELKQRYRDDGFDAALVPLDRPYLLPKRPKYREVRAQDIPLPAMWSTISFEKYVQDLTQSQVSRVNNRYIYNDRMTHVDVVHDVLIQVFEGTLLRPYLTPKAFDIALVYFYKHHKISSVRRLFNLMSELHMEIPTETFNVLLKGAAARKDLHQLTFILGYMGRKGVSPNAETWVALLRAVQSNRAKLVIYREMKKAGVLKYPATLQNAVMELLEFELASHIVGGQELAPFIKQLDTRYGPNWASLSVVNHLCHRLGENGLVSQAMEALKIATDRNIKPDSITLHIFLSHSLRLRRPKLAVEVVELFHSQYQIYPNEAAYDILFMVAFRSQRLQLCKVIWRYACLNGAVSFRMEQIVTRSLLRNTPAEPKTNLQRWMKTAGKAIVAIDLGVDATEPKPVWHPTGLEIMETLSRYTIRGKEREWAIRLAKKVVKMDMTASRRYVPVFPLVGMLKSALYGDSEWEETGKRDAPILWKVEHSIQVPIRVPTAKEIEAHARIAEWKMKLLRN